MPGFYWCALRGNKMRPLGRKTIQCPGAKHHVKDNGKKIKAWWEDCHDDSNTSARMQSKRDIKKQWLSYE